MGQLRTLFFCSVIAANAHFALAEDHKSEFEAHCQFVRAQAAAERDLLRTPAAIVEVTQPETGLAKQLIFGLSGSFSNLRKATLVENAAHAGCDFYDADTDAKEKLFFALPSIGKEVLHHRLDLIDQAMRHLDDLIDQNMKYVAAQNLTRPAMYSLQAAKLRLITDRTATLTGITSPYVPPQSAVSLKDMIAEKRSKDLVHEAALTAVQRQRNWDVTVNAGFHLQIGATSNPTTSPTGPYAIVSLSYNLSSQVINRNLSNSLTFYSRWQDSEFDDVAHQADLLRMQIVETITIEDNQLAELRKQAKAVDDQLNSLEGIETEAAMSFHNQLTADRIILEVNIGDAMFRAETLRRYLRSNF
jgi:hypothetical protein